MSVEYHSCGEENAAAERRTEELNRRIEANPASDEFVAETLRQYLARKTGRDAEIFSNYARFPKRVNLEAEIVAMRGLTPAQIRERVDADARYRPLKKK